MPLFNIDNQIQQPIGNKPCWKNYRIFAKDPLHGELVKHISNYIDQNYNKLTEINSNELGSRIINSIRINDNELYKHLTYNLHGGIFGMTLFNYLANDSRDWYFHAKSIGSFNDSKGSFYFKRLA
ncbi:MAG: hypothetical protein J0M18_21790 [Ignavibacteria bacterium]|nr:hypothetical protein [Ignavibacteria bacterium]